MQCPQCQHENSEAAKFCEECGTKLVRVCPGCGHEVSLRAKFCPACGTSLTGQTPVLKTLDSRLQTPDSSRPEAERRQLTVMFCDLVGSTALSTQLDPEELRQVILAYHVRGHGEIVIGDEIAGVKAVPSDKLRPWPLGTGQAVRDWLAARGGLGPTVA